MIDLTPLEVRKKKGDFRRALRGYEPALVDDFLDIVADRLEQLVREHASLTDRVTRLDQQVKEYRERERALTDALVTAQAMKETIKEQTTREAEELRQSAQQEAESQLRDAHEQADTTVRDAEQRAEERLRHAEQESTKRLRQAEQEATAKLEEARQEAYRLRSEAVRTRDQEEEMLRQLRARQQQLVSSYRGFLERELAELNAMAESIEAGEEPASGKGAAPAKDAAHAKDAAAAKAAAAAPAAVAAAPAAAATRRPAPAQSPPPAPPPPAPVAAVEPEEEEPFAPEPVYEEDLASEPVTRIEPATLLEAPVPEVAEESGEAAEESWPTLDMLGEGQEPDFSRPQPNPEALRLPGEEAVEAAAEEGGEEEADPETEALLQNAARAGYRLELADESELLLEEPAEETSESGDWLDTIIEEEK